MADYTITIDNKIFNGIAKAAEYLGMSKKDYKYRLDNGVPVQEILGDRAKVVHIENNGWKDIEVEFLKNNYANNGLKYCVEHLNRSSGAITAKASSLGLRCVPPHLKLDKDHLQKYFIDENKTIKDIAELLNSTYLIVRNALKYYKIYKKRKGRSGKANKLWSGHGEFSGHYWSGLVCRANKKQIENTISKEYIWDLFLKQDRKCALSGLEISVSPENMTGSLDRIDSNLGYIEENVQWVHKDINTMKNVFPEKYFIDLCLRVYNNSTQSEFKYQG